MALLSPTCPIILSHTGIVLSCGASLQSYKSLYLCLCLCASAVLCVRECVRAYASYKVFVCCLLVGASIVGVRARVCLCVQFACVCLFLTQCV